MTFGIRPEHVAGGANGPATLTVLPEAIEPLGPTTLVIGAVDGRGFVAQVDPHFPAEPEVPCPVTCDMTRMHLFDPETGRAL